jgi:hypothetical protein
MSQMIPACLPSRDASRPVSGVDAGPADTAPRILVTNPATLHGFPN